MFFQTDSITSLPPLPDSSGEITEVDSSYPLPPPPPEMFRSTLSLDSLPPPPAPNELPSLSDQNDLTGSQLSLMSLPPPPTPTAVDLRSSGDRGSNASLNSAERYLDLFHIPSLLNLIFMKYWVGA